ncbi:unnamed protein product, partial [Musa acuminata subsp. burmannicoides]
MAMATAKRTIRRWSTRPSNNAMLSAPRIWIDIRGGSHQERDGN